MAMSIRVQKMDGQIVQCGLAGFVDYPEDGCLCNSFRIENTKKWIWRNLFVSEVFWAKIDVTLLLSVAYKKIGKWVFFWRRAVRSWGWKRGDFGCFGDHDSIVRVCAN